MKKIGFFLLVFLFFGCSSVKPPPTYRIGVDPTFYPIDFKEQQKYVFGFIDELLLEITKVEKVEFVRVLANWDTLYSGLSKNYDAIISSEKPYNFNEVKYDFSLIFLQTGLTLVTPFFSNEELTSLKAKRIGSLTQDISLPNSEGMYLSLYEDIAEAFMDVIERKIDGALLPIITAVYYGKHLFLQEVKMTAPLTQEGLRFLTLKDKQSDLQKILASGLKKLQVNGTLQKLETKWGLYTKELFPISIFKKE